MENLDTSLRNSNFKESLVTSSWSSFLTIHLGIHRTVLKSEFLGVLLAREVVLVLLSSKSPVEYIRFPIFWENSQTQGWEHPVSAG